MKYSVLNNNHSWSFFTEKHRCGRSNWLWRWSLLCDNTFQLFQERQVPPPLPLPVGAHECLDYDKVKADIPFTNAHKFSALLLIFPEANDKICRQTASGVGVRLKVGDKYWEDWRAGVWGGAVSSPVGGLGLPPEKKINFALKIMQLWASFGTSFLYYSRKWGIIPTVLKVGDLSPCPPCSDAYAPVTKNVTPAGPEPTHNIAANESSGRPLCPIYVVRLNKGHVGHYLWAVDDRPCRP